MAWDLGAHLTWGQLANTRRNRVEGVLYLAHQREPIWLDLVGNCGPGLVGREVRFVPRQPRLAHAPSTRPRISSHQVGVAHQVDLGPGSKHDSVGEQLHVEWSGPEGRVRLLLDEPQVEYITAIPESQWESPTDQADLLVAELPAAQWDRHYGMWIGPEEDLHPWDPMLDEILPACESVVPLRELLVPPIDMPEACLLESDRLWTILEQTIAQLARIGVAISACDHLSLRDIYRVISERLLPQAEVEPALLRDHGVDYVSTTWFCPRCREQWRITEDELPP